MEDESIQLLARWRAGDQQAAAKLFQRYAERLIGLAHTRLSANLAGRVDAEDIVQSVYRSFYAGARDGRFVLERSGDLWRLLVAITLHKLHNQVAYHSAAKRSVGREQQTATEDSLFGIEAQALSHDPSPVEALALTETLEALLRTLNPVHRRIVELRLQGYSVPEIIADTQRSRALVHRVLERVRQQLSGEW